MFVLQETVAMHVCRSVQPELFPWILGRFSLLLMKDFALVVGSVNTYVVP